MESESLDIYLKQFQTQNTNSIINFNEVILNKFITLESTCEDTKNKYIEKLNNKDIEITQHKSDFESLQNKCEELQSEINTYGKVSIVKNLNKQILEKDLEIKILNKKVKFLEEKNVKMSIVDKTDQDCIQLDVNHEREPDISSVSESEESKTTEVSNNEEEAEVSNNDEEVEVFEKKLRGTIYYITDDCDKYIYQKLDDGSIGECVGKYNSKNRPHFFKNKTK
jgi:hypothetical protein